MATDHTTPLGILGGTGLTALEGLAITGREAAGTPYGEPSAPLVHGRFAGRPLVFLARHGEKHSIPPHKVNYRANLWALQEAGVAEVIAVAAVGAIDPDFPTGGLAIPDQLIDYTYGRAHTFFEEHLTEVVHVDFTEPYCPQLRERLIHAARQASVDLREGGTYGATQGPRLETAAEIKRMARDGCDMVGMTGMPEAALARELGLCYATCAVAANPAAGRAEGEIRMEDIRASIQAGIERFRMLLAYAVKL